MTNPQEDRQNNSATGLLLLALIAGLGLGLRLWQLTRLSFWSDECLTLAITRLSPMQLLEIILTTDVHPPGITTLSRCGSA